MSLTNEQLVVQAVEMARAADRGEPASPAAQSLLRAIAETRTEGERHELARQATERLADLTAVGLGVLRFALAVV